MEEGTLTRDEEVALVSRWRAGEAAALHELVLRHRGLVYRGARRYCRRGHAAFDEYVQEGVLGLLEAAHRFDPERGFRFMTYAQWWVRFHLQTLNHRFRNGCSRPRDRAGRRVIERGARTVRSLRDRLGRAPTAAEIAAELDVDLDHYLRVVRYYSAPADAIVGTDREHLDDGPSGSRAHQIVAPDDVERDAMHRQELDRLFAALAGLNERHQRTLWGIYFEDRTLRDIGAEMGISHERVRQLHQKALARLRRSMAPATHAA